MTKLKKHNAQSEKDCQSSYVWLCGERRLRPIPLCLFRGHMTLRLTLNRPPILTVDNHYDEDNFVDCYVKRRESEIVVITFIRANKISISPPPSPPSWENIWCGTNPIDPSVGGTISAISVSEKVYTNLSNAGEFKWKFSQYQKENSWSCTNDR